MPSTLCSYLGKKTKSEVLPNQFIQTHQKDDLRSMNRPSKSHSTSIEDYDLQVTESLKRINELMKKLAIARPKSLTPVTLFKRYSSDTPENLIFGHMIKDEAWLYGYGLDGENGMYRNLKEIKGTHVEVD